MPMQDETNSAEPAERQSIATPGYPDPSLSTGTAEKKRKRHYLPAIIAAAVLVVALVIVLSMVLAKK